MRDFALASLILLGCGSADVLAGDSAAQSPPTVEVASSDAAVSRVVRRVGTLAADVLDESSGLVASSRSAGVFWTHNDSGGEPVLFATDPAGADRGRVRVEGARAKDWEAVAAHDGVLYIGDIGNNRNRRKDLTVYVVPEPLPTDVSVRATSAIRFRFPDQQAFPPRDLFFDAESLVHDGAHLYLLTKRRGDLATTSYRFPPGEDVVLERLDDFEVGGVGAPYPGMVTGADLSSDGRLAVLTYHAVFVFPSPAAPGRWLQGEPRRIPLEPLLAAQCEGIAWDGDTLLFTNEGRGVFRVDLSAR